MIYKGDGWEVREGRWEDSPPESCDVVISDAPYDRKTHNGMRRTLGTEKNGKRKFNEKKAINYPPIAPADVALPLVAIAERWVVLFCAIEQLGWYQEAAGKAYIRGGWYWKIAPQPQLSSDRPGTPGDGIAILHREGRKRWNGRGQVARWCASSSHIHYRDGRYHDQQKPLFLMLELVRLFSDPGELVWDPYGGSMTTGVACLALGRRFLGHEMQPHYAQIGAERLKAAERGQSLQEYKAGQMHLFADAE